MRRKIPRISSQLELNISQDIEPDRNFSRGGRSFYFFDFDDNVAFLSTEIYLFHKQTGREISVSSKDFAEQSAHVGRRGPYRDYEVFLDDQKGSFRNFRDQNFGWLERVLGRRQTFLQDLAHALGYPDFNWQGPSWSCFRHAVHNRRPLSLITARGHHPETLKSGIRLMVEKGLLPHEPNYLALFPVSHPETRARLNGHEKSRVPQLKQAAIRASVLEALRVYGDSIHHRFGMSDDDPENLRLIMEEMARLKKDMPRNSFFVIETHRGQFVKREVFPDYTIDQVLLPVGEQLSLFEK